jgi:nucleotide-binding universal stress UspA family protein
LACVTLADPKQSRAGSDMTESILVATDGSEGASAAERCGVALASRLGARLSGVTIVEDRDVRAPSSDDLAVPAFPESELTAFHKALAEAVSRRFGERARGEASCDSLTGAADDRIVERGQNADLIVLGRDGKSSPGRRVLIGGTVESVVRKSTRSCVVVPSGASLGGPIVLGFDGSPGSRAAASLAVELANGLGESVHVFVDSKDKGRAVARFEEVRQLVGGLSVPVAETSSTLGRPDVKLVDTAREARAGLIVIGAYGRNRISDYFIGSNAASVVRTSPVGVVLAR